MLLSSWLQTITTLTQNLPCYPFAPPSIKTIMTNHLKSFERYMINQSLHKLPGLQTPVHPLLLLMTLIPKGYPLTIATHNLMFRPNNNNNFNALKRVRIIIS